MFGHGGSSNGSYLDDPTFPIPSHCAVIILHIELQWPVVHIQNPSNIETYRLAGM